MGLVLPVLNILSFPVFYVCLIVLGVHVHCQVCTESPPCCVPTTVVALLARVCSAKDKQGGNTCGHRRVLAAFFGPALLLPSKASSTRLLFEQTARQASPCYSMVTTSLPGDDALLQRNFSAASHA